MKSGVFFLVLLWVAIAGCKRPSDESSFNQSPDIVFTTSLADTLPPKTIEQLHLGKIRGTRFLSVNGTDIRYFEYTCDPEKLLRALSISGFDIDAKIADTACRRISKDVLLTALNRDRNDYDLKFLNAVSNDVDIYECVKPPLFHHIVVNRTSKKVIHRVVISV
jgi:hypothetical protein